MVNFSDVPSPNFPNVPTIFEVIPVDKQTAMHTLVNIYALERVIIAPPNLPERRLQTLREALDKVMSDPEFLENMANIKRPVNYLSGQETSDLLADILLRAGQVKALVFEIARDSR